ncbi:flagellar motor switch protein FliN [Kumtagia ephedrae]|jgi:flagellar motor switch protein FliN/FliY|uniref:Flagellar motor switch protein FliN n=1 Tax=Kumtagia ephedrae TaxID=2116701 RepID=A0A2P7SLR1_9HYPH|nr:flagellar motor switch protein FliN [Mesorhizobium ephedrae]PSJ63321.1 flagellar motor switch protein FliN [Mesorhizobium ephedrae]
MSDGGKAAVQDQGEEQLNRAIEELRGVLNEDAGAQRPAAAPNAGIIMNIPVEVQIVLGSTDMAVSELMALQKGSTVALNRRVGEPVDVTVNGRRIARGEITVLDSDPSRFGIRLTEIIATGSV